MASCINPKAINDGKTLNFGFSTVFNPYLKTVTFNSTGLSTFTSTVGVYFSFQVTDPNGGVVGVLTYGTGGMNVATGVTSLSLNLLNGGVLFYGTYTIKARAWKDGSSYTDLDYTVEVCYDQRLENNNSITGCITVDTNCSTAKMTIKEQTNFKYNGLSPIAGGKTYAGTLDFPNGYLSQKVFTYVPYSVDLDGAITGLYQIKVVTTARYLIDDCHAYIDVTYISQDNPQVSCSGALSTLLCCWTQSIEIANRGGNQGALMAEKLYQAEPIFNMALLQEFNGKNSELAVKELQSILGCDCKCQAGLTIQANPILLNGKNLVGTCAIGVEYAGEDIIISTAIIEIESCDSGTGFSFEKTVDGCTKTWCLKIDFDVVQQQVLNAIAADSDNIVNWKNVLGINSCPCKMNVVLISQTGDAPSVDAPLTFSQITLCDGNIITLGTAVTVTTIAGIVTALNANATLTATYGANTFSLSSSGTGIVSSYLPTTGTCSVVIFLYENCSNVVIVNGTPLVISTARLSTYYAVLSDKYFTKSDTIIAIDLMDITSITNGVLGTIDIAETTTGGTNSFVNTGDVYGLDASDVCAATLILRTGILTQTTTTSKNCVSRTTKNTSYARVAYSERYTENYRANPQINDLPYYGDWIYLANTSSPSSVVRMYNTVTRETRTIAGVLGLAKSPATLNNVLGNAVEYDFISSIYADKSDVNNSHATLYFCTIGGVFCKLVRETSNACDERANWRNYILAGANGVSTATLPQAGTNARFTVPYGIKRFGTISGQPSFIVYNQGSARLDFIYYKILSGVNSSANWYVEAFPLSAPTNAGNINVNRETVTISDVVYTSILTLYVFGGGKIDKYYFTGSETTYADLVNVLKYTAISIINQAVGSVDGLGSTVGRVNNPISLSKITYDGNDTFVFSEEYSGSIPIGAQVLRGFYASTAPPSGPSSYTFVTIVPDNNKGYSTFGYANSGSGTPTANGTTSGIFYHPIKSKYFELPISGGIRTFCPNANVTQATIIYANESGAVSLAATAQDLSTGVVDTNYELIIS